MEHTTSLTSLMIVVALAFLVPVLLHQFRLKLIPVVVAEILVGLAVGKTGFDWVKEDPWLELLSLFGFIFLMFLSGLEIDFGALRGKGARASGGVNPLKASLLIFAMILALSYAASYGMAEVGLASDPYLMTIIISTISLGVVVPVLKENRLMPTPLGQTILLTTVISDFVTMILLAVYISMLSGKASDVILLLLFFVVVFAVYRFIRRFQGKGLLRLLGSGTSQVGTRAVFALILLFVVLSESFGVENILGAFLAGVIVSLMAPRKELVHQLESFGYGFLIPIFFVMVGVRLDLRALFANPKVLIFIPLLLAAVFLTKLIPALLLRRWFSWRESLASGVLLSSTLSLVIAAATLALELGIIDGDTHGALIMMAVLSCLLFPILFNQMFPKLVPTPTKVSIVGANHMTLPISLDLQKDGYEVGLFSARSASGDERGEHQDYSRFPLRKLTDLSEDTLNKHGVFDADIVVAGSMNDADNTRLARLARDREVPHIVVRIEDPALMETVRTEGFNVFSTLNASRTLLKALIEHPSAVRLLSQENDTLREIRMDNPQYHEIPLRQLPFLGDALIVRIYRGESFLIPHGSTLLLRGDRLLVSGGAEQLEALTRELE